MDSYIFTDEFDHRVVTGNSGKYPLGVSVHEIAQRQVGGNHRGFLSEDPLVDAKEKLRSYETVGKLRAEVIDDQQIAVENLIIFALGSLRV